MRLGLFFSCWLAFRHRCGGTAAAVCQKHWAPDTKRHVKLASIDGRPTKARISRCFVAKKKSTSVVFNMFAHSSIDSATAKRHTYNPHPGCVKVGPGLTMLVSCFCSEALVLPFSFFGRGASPGSGFARGVVFLDGG